MSQTTDILIVGGIAILAGAWLFYPDVFSGIIPPGFGVIPPAEGGGEFLGGGEFVNGGSGSSGGEFIVEDTPNPSGDCKSRYNGKCGSECKTDRYSARCQDCISICGGGGGQAPGMCFSVGHDRSVPCGTTANTCNKASNGRLMCKCGSNVRGNKVRDDRLFQMGPGRTCATCTQYCKTGSVPKQVNTPSQPATTPFPKKLSANCTQVSNNCYRWTSSGKSQQKCVSSGTSTNNGCMAARSAWLSAYSGGSSGGGTAPKPQPTQKRCNLSDSCNTITSGTYKNYKTCKCACIGDSWRMGPATSCSTCHSQCVSKRRSKGYASAAYFYDEGVDEYYFANMAVSV